MKVFIHYKPKNAADAFEGTRLRKTLKGACEVVDVSWVDTPQEEVCIAHFLSPHDLPLLRSQKEQGIPTVVSAFYAEDDPGASFLAGNKGLNISKKGLAMMNEANLVLVPDEKLAAIAKEQGVKSRIEVLEPAVRMNRFSDTATEKKIFRRYYGIRPDVKTVVATGSYGDKTTLNLFKSVAEACPNLEFYFFGAMVDGDVLNIAKRVMRVRRSPNVHLKDIVQDDVYRSALMNSIAYISNDSIRPDPIAPIEAFAAKTQVVAFTHPNPSPILVEGKTCFFFKTPEGMARYLDSLNSDGAKSTITSAFAVAKAHNLVSYGRKLKEYYEALLQENHHD